MSTERVSWESMTATETEPAPGSMVLDPNGTVWVRPNVPGRPDQWYRVGGGRGLSAVNWPDLKDQPLFIARAAREVLGIVEVAYEVAERMGWAGPDRPAADGSELA